MSDFAYITLVNPPNDTHRREIINPHLTGEKKKPASGKAGYTYKTIKVYFGWDHEIAVF